MFYQFYGIMAVITGLNDNAILFGKNGLIRSALCWLASFRGVFARPRTVEAAGASVGISSASAVASVGTVRINPRLEDRVVELEKKLGTLENHMNVKIQETKDYARSLVDDETVARRIEQTQISKKVQDALFGGLTLQVGGALFLIFGVIFTSIPDELASLLR
jgi:hypothetical protein